MSVNTRFNTKTIAPYPFVGGDPLCPWESPSSLHSNNSIGVGRYPFSGGDTLQPWEKTSRSRAPYPGGDAGDD